MPNLTPRERFEDMFTDMQYQSLTEHKKRICWSFIETLLEEARQETQEKCLLKIDEYFK